MYGTKHRPVITDYIGGLGGRDVTVDDVKEMLIATVKAVESGEPGPEETWHDLMEE
jgi:2-oxoisovalerate ferredoxin oxidoreductase alpha subunit